MTRTALLAAAAVLATSLAAPAMAQEVVSNPGYCAQFYPNANCQNKGPGNPYTGSYQRQVYGEPGWQHRGYGHDRGWRHSYNRYDDDGFAPGPARRGLAVGIGAAPIGGDEYARRNGFVCIPGTRFPGEDGLMHLCQ
jgi:opacity protein-like surface antigen